jgi:hypothetical protein
MTHFELSFYTWQEVSLSIFSTYIVQLFQHIYWKACSFLFWTALAPLQKINWLYIFLKFSLILLIHVCLSTNTTHYFK